MSEAVPSASTSRSSPRIVLPADMSPAEIVQAPAKVASPFQVTKHKKDAAKQWDLFYKSHAATPFFKDRHWTDREFDGLKELCQQSIADKGKGKSKVILEVGCGTGAFVYPLLERFPELKFQMFDFSKRAVDMVKANPAYDPSHVHAFVHDLTSPTLPAQLRAAPPQFWDSPSSPLPPTAHLVDLISCVFVLSALPPKAQSPALLSLLSALAPGGTLILRDYALHDEAQLRLHALPSKSYASVPSLLSAPVPLEGAALADGVDQEEVGKAWYRRGDGTMTYFFGVGEMEGLVGGAREVDGEGRGWRLEGGAVEVVREMENRKEAWGCTRRFVQGSWKKVAC